MDKNCCVSHWESIILGLACHVGTQAIPRFCSRTPNLYTRAHLEGPEIAATPFLCSRTPNLYTRAHLEDPEIASVCETRATPFPEKL
jgi:hypothetical protein